MKPDIHPPFYQDAKITCTACGAIFRIPGTVKEVHIEVCSNCHPVYTGKYRGAVSSGRVERFQKKLAAAAKAPPRTVKHKKLTPEEKLERKLEIKRGEKAAKEKKTSKPASAQPSPRLSTSPSGLPPSPRLRWTSRGTSRPASKATAGKKKK